MAVLKDKSEMATGDPILCESCKAVLNKFSKVTGLEDMSQTWTCEFCNH